uniref:Uncharacterized protein n=1 Tax=Nothobranchius kadleci TaxID=1051664 RepID=A0A1A8BJ85_NOTKA
MEDHTYSSSKLEKRDSLSHPSKRKRILKSEQDRRHEKTRVNIGVAFPRWRDLMLQKGFSRHAELATFLLDSYERTLATTTSTPMKGKHRSMEDPPLSSISSGNEKDEHLSGVTGTPEIESLQQSVHDMVISEDDLDEDVFNDPMNSVIDWEDRENMSSAEQRDDSSDDEYLPPISIRMGGALKSAPSIDGLPIIGLDETVHDLQGCGDDPQECLADVDVPILPGTEKVIVAEDIVGVRAAVVYENCLKQLVEFITLPLDRFKRKYNKNARRYSVYSLKSEKGYEYIPVLQSKIINERLARGVGMPRTRSMRDDDPRRLGLVPPIAPPPISELVQIQVSRGLVSELNTATGLQ